MAQFLQSSGFNKVSHFPPRKSGFEMNLVDDQKTTRRTVQVENDV